MNLVVGATGLLGGMICRRLCSIGQPVRALVRKSSNPGKVAELRAAGAEIVLGDLKDAASLLPACAGVSAVIATATGLSSHEAGDSIESVDRTGYFSLIDAALRGRVERFVYTSVNTLRRYPSPLTHAKVAVEQRLRESGLEYTILAANRLMEYWLSPALGFDYAAGRVLIPGNGEKPITWVSCRDVAEVAIRSLTSQAARRAAVGVGGPENLSPLEVVRVFEEISGRAFAVELLPVEMLQRELHETSEPRAASLAASKLDYAEGSITDTSLLVSAFPLRLWRVRDYARAAVRSRAAA